MVRYQSVFICKIQMDYADDDDDDDDDMFISLSSHLLTYRNFACIRRTFFTQIFTHNSGVRLIHRARKPGCFNRVPRPRGDRKSITRHYRTETPYQNKPLVCFHFNILWF